MNEEYNYIKIIGIILMIISSIIAFKSADKSSSDKNCEYNLENDELMEV